MRLAEEALFAREDWWNPNGAFRLLHDVNPIRLEWSQSICGDLSNKKLFDFGCGGGIFSEGAAKAGAKVVAVDASSEAIGIAKKHAKQEGLDIDYRHQKEIIDESPGSYDIVTCFEALEHIEQPQKIITTLSTLLNKNGIALFSTINRTFCSWALMIGGLELLLKVLPTNTHCYEGFIRPQELAMMCKHSGLSVTMVTGLRYSFLGRYYYLDENNLNVNYFMAAQRKD